MGEIIDTAKMGWKFGSNIGHNILEKATHKHEFKHDRNIEILKCACGKEIQVVKE